MKKVLLFTIAAATGISSFAKDHNYSSIQKVNPRVAAKGTAIGDTLVLANDIHDTISYYHYTTGAAGAVFGLNSIGTDAYAERYDFNPQDSSMAVIGVVTQFHGDVNPNTTKTVKMMIWAQGAPSGTSPILFNGLPGAAIDSTTAVSILNIGATTDSTKYFPLLSVTGDLTDSFFCGYKINYSPTALDGDTIGLWSSQDGERTAGTFTISGPDTTYNVKNALHLSGQWGDIFRFTGLKIDLAIFPVVAINTPVSVHGVTKNDLTLFGTYPNPATTNTNVKFSLNKSADVTIQLMDMSGRTISQKVLNNLGTGEHAIPVETSGLAAGNYIVLLHTSAGDGIGCKLVISK